MRRALRRASADLGERPAVTEVGGGLEGGLESAAAGEDDGDEIQIGGEGVAEVAAATFDPFGQPKVRPHEPSEPQADRAEDGQSWRHRYTSRREDEAEDHGERAARRSLRASFSKACCSIGLSRGAEPLLAAHRDPPSPSPRRNGPTACPMSSGRPAPVTGARFRSDSGERGRSRSARARRAVSVEGVSPGTRGRHQARSRHRRP